MVVVVFYYLGVNVFGVKVCCINVGEEFYYWYWLVDVGGDGG